MSGVGAIAARPFALASVMNVAPDPQSHLDDLRPAAHGELPAGFLRRSAAAAIDGTVVLLFQLLISIVLVGGLSLSTSRDDFGTADLPYYGMTAGFLILYFAVAESGPHAATWGKRALGLAVRDRTGEPPGFRRALLRLLLRFLTTGTLLLGWLTILFTPRRQALHDLLSGTVVVVVGNSHQTENRGERRR